MFPSWRIPRSIVDIPDHQLIELLREQDFQSDRTSLEVELAGRLLSAVRFTQWQEAERARETARLWDQALASASS
jgi:hypothetical protein